MRTWKSKKIKNRKAWRGRSLSCSKTKYLFLRMPEQKCPKPRWWWKENVFLSRLELIGLICRLKISKMSKNAFFLKSSTSMDKHTNVFLRASSYDIQDKIFLWKKVSNQWPHLAHSGVNLFYYLTYLSKWYRNSHRPCLLAFIVKPWTLYSIHWSA